MTSDGGAGAATKSRKPTTTTAAAAGDDNATDTAGDPAAAPAAATDDEDALTSKLFRKISTETVKKILELLCDEGGFLVESRLHRILAPLDRYGRCTMGENSQEYRLKYWATRSSVRSFARTAHSFAASLLFDLLARSSALIRPLAHSLPRSLGKCI